MIEAHALTRKFGDLIAVNDLNLEIQQGEFFAFLGPNAAGKTTTIKMLTGLLQPTAGTVKICGHDMATDGEAARRLLSYVPDFPFLYDKLTPWEFMRFMGELFLLEKAEIERKAGLLFEKFHLSEYGGEIIENLSHGTRQRLAISSGLLHDPKVFIIDEPMVGLDPAHARIVKNEFKERSQAGTTFFLSTHTLAVAEEIADRIGIINHGRLIALGTVDELRASSSESGALEKVFLSLIDAEEKHREAVSAADGKRKIGH